MLQPVVEIEIDGEKYQVMPLSTSKSIAVLSEALKIAGLSLKNGMIFDEKGLGLESILSQNIDIAKIFGDILSNLNSKNVNTIVCDLLCATMHTGSGMLTPATIDVHFSRRLPHLFKVVKAVAEVEYKDFFVLFSNLKAKGGQESQE